MTMKPLNIIISGVGGQGNLLASHVIAKAAVDLGFHVITSETFGASQRGGAVASHIRIADFQLGPVIPEGLCDILVGFEPLETLRYATRHLRTGGTVIVNTHPVLPVNVIIGADRYPDTTRALELLRQASNNFYAFDATELAVQAGSALAMNMVMAGALIGTGTTPITRDAIIAAVEASVRPQTLKTNIQAIDNGIKIVRSSK